MISVARRFRRSSDSRDASRSPSGRTATARPHPHRFLASLLEQDGERRRASRRQLESENFQKGMAIVDGPVGPVKVAGSENSLKG
jgi:hypothetical protein